MHHLTRDPGPRLVEEVKLRAADCQLQNEDVYMNTSFQEFIQMCVRKLRGEDGEEELQVDYVSLRQLRLLVLVRPWMGDHTGPVEVSEDR